MDPSRPSVFRIRGEGAVIVYVDPGPEPRTRYLAARKLQSELPEVPFPELLARLREGGEIAIFRVQRAEDAERFHRVLDLEGTRVWTVEQRKIGEFDVY
ncbi:MAG TPA: hypothetical protein VMV46_05690 [Thermoanaerobaculia bacterium]|nr:hypothetical protein [Thermoanaerobaculia bacterium]